MGSRSKRPKGADGEDDETHARRQNTVLGLGGVAGDGDMSGEALAISVVSVKVRRGSDVKGLHVIQHEGPGPIKPTEDDVRAVPESAGSAEKPFASIASQRASDIVRPSTR